MGFLSFFSKIIQGKPVFENQLSTPQMPQTQPAQQQFGGPKVIPQVYIERIESHTNGNQTVWDAIIQNYSQQPVELEKIELLGHAEFIEDHLQPGQEREHRIF